MDLHRNIQHVNRLINEALQKSVNPERSVKLIAVTNTVPTELIRKAAESGLTDFGENKVQELVSKYQELDSHIQWHMIGHLQRNKVKYIVDKVSLIHSLDSYSLAKEIEKRASASNQIIDCLIQVNVSGEKSKYGIDSTKTMELIQNLEPFKHIKIKGLMTMAPLTANQAVARDCFKKLYELQQEVIQRNYAEIDMEYLSMGMSNDFQAAIEEGSNMIRIGSAIFGERDYD